MNRRQILILLFLSKCTGNGSLTVNYTPSASVTHDCIEMTQGSKYAMGGYARFEQPQLKNTTTYLDLASPSIAVKPIRQALVQVIDVKADRVIAWTKTDEAGLYSIRYDEPDGNTIRIRVLARIYANAQNGNFRTDDSCNLLLSVLDNTSGAALYAVSSAETSKGTGLVNVTAAYSPSRASAPFSVLDTTLTSAQTILAAKPDIIFKPLNLYWSPANTNASGNVKTGLIGTTYFGQDVFSDSTKGAIYVLGAANVDTDEYDSNVIAHEFGHYLEYAVYRSDSIGGAHSLSALVDLSLAFSEAWGNFFSGVVQQNSVYTDSNGLNNASGLNFNLETNTANNVYNEASVQSALWDIYDAAGDNGELVNCPLSTMSKAFMGLKSDAAAVSYLSFANVLQTQLQPCVSSGLTAIHTNLGTGTIASSFSGTTQPTAACRTAAYLTATLPVYGDANTINLGFSSGGTNNYCAVKWYRVTGNGTTRTMTLSGISASCNLDLYVTQGSSIVALSKNSGLGVSESVTVSLTNAADYVIRIYTVTPNNGTCSYALNIT